MDNKAAALVFDQLTTDVGDALDLWRYADVAAPDLPARFALGLSPWATPAVLSMIVLSSIYEVRRSRSIPPKRNNDE